MDKQNITIVSDGISSGTRVFAGDTEITGVTFIELSPIGIESIVEAIITFEMVKLGKSVSLDKD